ncbi:MAG: SDR family oxidoreductase [Chloroflexota bacterium]|nr:SDR family oxidoreductase [Chloroflexota bacterium]
MTDLFRERHYLVTGAASGIGLALAKRLAARGTRLTLWDVNADALDAAAAATQGLPQRVDISDSAQVTETLALAVEQQGALHGVIHSAALLYTGMFAEMPLAEHARLVNVNLGGTVQVVYAALPHLRATRGALVLLSSVSSFLPSPEFGTYAATKAGVLSLAQTLRLELEDDGVYIGVANPLFVSSPMLNERARSTASFNMKSPMLRVYPPEAVADSIIRGIERRQFMIWTGLRPRLLYWLSRYGAWATSPLTRYTWRRG